MSTTSQLASLSSHKIASRHFERAAVVYVRQSTAQQLVNNQESTRMQYGLVQRAEALGWPSDRVVVIDDDLGRSGSSAEGRPGFQRLVAEVGLDHVGAIFGIEMSRLARSCRDWHQLLEVCSIFGTLIADLDGVYDPSNYNDRLLLGLKGTMSEAELHVLRQRLLQGKLIKARRGEVALPLPIGYARRASGEVIKDPDQEVQSVVDMLFEQFDAHGTLYGVLRYFVRNGLRMPVRQVTGANRGDLEWRRPNVTTLSHILHNPIYAGAYAYGRSRVDPRRQQPGRPSTGRRKLSRGEDWEVLLKDRLPAYINWERYEANVAQLAANCTRVQGVPRPGPALLAGLLRCGRCGRRLIVNYSGGSLRYVCTTESSVYGAPSCTAFAGRALDQHLAELVLRALQPAALEVSLHVAEDIQAERLRVDTTWKQRLERTQYDVDRAMRQYNAVEPENRLVVRTLEKQLEDKLATHQKLRNEHDRFVAQQPAVLTAAERDAIRGLAQNLPDVWAAPTTTPMDRQTIIRQLVEQIVVNVRGSTEQLETVTHWVGGHRTESTVSRPVWRFDQLSYHRELITRVAQLRAAGQQWRAVAATLNAEQWQCARGKAVFTEASVRKIGERYGVGQLRPKPPPPKLGSDEWSLTALAYELDMPTVTMLGWRRRAWVRARLIPGPRVQWAIWADAAELARLRALRKASVAAGRAGTSMAAA